MKFVSQRCFALHTKEVQQTQRDVKLGGVLRFFQPQAATKETTMVAVSKF